MHITHYTICLASCHTRTHTHTYAYPIHVELALPLWLDAFKANHHSFRQIHHRTHSPWLVDSDNAGTPTKSTAYCTSARIRLRGFYAPYRSNWITLDLSWSDGIPSCMTTCACVCIFGAFKKSERARESFTICISILYDDNVLHCAIQTCARFVMVVCTPNRSH